MPDPVSAGRKEAVPELRVNVRTPTVEVFRRAWLTACFTPGMQQGSQGHGAGEASTGPSQWRDGC